MKKYFVIAVVLVLGLAVSLVVLLLGNGRQPAPVGTSTPAPSPSVTATPVDNGAVLEQYSSEFGAAYFNYSRIDDPKYLDSIRPFLGKDLYAEIVADNRRAGSRATALSSKVLSAETTEQDADSGRVTLRIRSRQGELILFNQTLTLDWTKRGERWVITQFTLESTTRKHPYLEE
ncbi:MAG: hypothetical protein Q8Q11_00165 [bacterium]|nr:hypothetical protein [bacterium]MDZ4247733.1 hypothetical protein [Patescibacteria group bacterium]